MGTNMTEKKGLQIEDIHVSSGDKEILRGITLSLMPGEMHVVMGLNGSGKTTMALALAGAPGYSITKGRVLLDGRDITSMSPDERARAGLIITFQHPPEILGVRIIDFMKKLLESKKGIDPVRAHDIVVEEAKKLGFDDSYLSRYINSGFSGGERKRLELLSALLLEPKYIVMDEIDSGVDVDSLNIIGRIIRELHNKGMGIIIITHYARILEAINTPIDRVHVLKDGRFVMEGDDELVKRIERDGFQKVYQECGCDEQ